MSFAIGTQIGTEFPGTVPTGSINLKDLHRFSPSVAFVQQTMPLNG